MGAFAQSERDLICERQREGIALAKRRERAVLQCDGYCCRLCGGLGKGKAVLLWCTTAYPRRLELNFVISLCPACDAKVGRKRRSFSRAAGSVGVVAWSNTPRDTSR